MHKSFQVFSVELNFRVLVVFTAVRFLVLSRVSEIVQMVKNLKKAINDGVKEDQITVECFRGLITGHYYFVDQNHSR